MFLPVRVGSVSPKMKSHLVCTTSVDHGDHFFQAHLSKIYLDFFLV